jgi:hypothetical protein
MIFKTSEIIQDITRLMDAIDHIGGVHIMGGEALLHPDLPQLMEKLLQQEKIGHVGLTTNGTILPGPELLTVMQHPKAEVYLSNYSSVTSTGEWKAQLEKSGVSYHIAGAEKLWVDAGGVEYRGRTRDALRAIYGRCLYRECAVLLDGRLFICPRNANAVQQNVIPFEQSGGVDIRKENTATCRTKIEHMLYQTEYLTCCDRCDYILPDGSQKYIPRAT